MNRTPLSNNRMSRRQMLQSSSAGFGSLALAGLLAQESVAAEKSRVQRPHFAAKAKRVIFVFLHGGPSQVDTFDYKPELQKHSGKPFTYAKPRIVSSQTGNLLGSPFRFRQHGESGIHVSEIFPHVGSCVDDICFINSMHCSNSRHGSALLELHTGSDTFIRPSMGSWINYGLGTENENLPGYITFCPSMSHSGSNAYSSAFLPAHYSGTPIGFAGVKADQAKIRHITNENTSLTEQRRELDLIQTLNRQYLEDSGPDSNLESRIESFELAFRMQTAVPELQDLSDETDATKRMYGIDEGRTKDFGTQCLMARRFAEAGVRFVEVSHRYWDAHGQVEQNHRKNAGEVDKPIAGLIRDL
ncbi:MAG: DUF1501 domain-containing protein, partial [Planctomycetales bacterium]|nr:DUF1501 domain-containing protein [Planctomycetales bacterium]